MVALIDELAHTNEPGSSFPKRFDDVIAVLRQGISVMTTLNVQHLEGLGDAVERLTGTHVRETLPDAILELADDVIFVDVTPEVLRERLREGKIYPKERIDSALCALLSHRKLGGVARAGGARTDARAHGSAATHRRSRESSSACARASATLV